MPTVDQPGMRQLVPGKIARTHWPADRETTTLGAHQTISSSRYLTPEAHQTISRFGDAPKKSTKVFSPTPLLPTLLFRVRFDTASDFSADVGMSNRLEATSHYFLVDCPTLPQAPNI